jgi:hypothetical protein
MPEGRPAIPATVKRAVLVEAGHRCAIPTCRQAPFAGKAVRRVRPTARAVDRVLIEQLHGQAGKRSFDSSWVWLDLLEALCLLIVARLLSRRHRATSPVAAATAAVLCMDAWFDTMSAAPKLPYAESLAMACFAELPLAAGRARMLARVGWCGLHPGRRLVN